MLGGSVGRLAVKYCRKKEAYQQLTDGHLFEAGMLTFL